MEKSGAYRFWFVFSCFAFFQALSVHGHPALRSDFYKSSCPRAEAIVKEVVYEHVARNTSIAAGLIRMHFHDCFVRGCEASVLLDSKQGKEAEKEAIPNQTLIGFDVIEEAKAKLEAECPETVSCADIIAFAARDSVLRAGNIPYAVPAGRRDGNISSADEAIQNLPPPFFNVQQLEQNFARKGLSLDEMVTLSGAHSIGVSRCNAFSNRLYSFNATHKQDPSMDRAFAASLKIKCPPIKSAGNLAVDLDFLTPYRLDNNYYKVLQYRKGLLESDQVLMSNSSTAKMVWSNANYPSLWAEKFAGAMVRMGEIEVLTGTQGEIRKKCSVVNWA